ncbi:MAG: AAA family ATPase [Parcubacteria group bacterium]
MIKKLKKIKNLGLFSDYTWDNNLDDFDKYNLFYGWNGSGKTTLSKLFACLEVGNTPEFSDLEYDIEHENGNCKENTQLNKKVRVFNQDYIQKNVQLVSGKANPIFILGEENKEIADQIKVDENTLSNLETQKSSKEVEKIKKDNDKGNKFTEVAKIIGANLVGSSTRNYRKPDAEKDFATLMEKKILSADEVTKQQAVIKQEQKDKVPEIEFVVDLGLSALYEEVSNICKETVEINVISHLTENQNISEWVEKGLTLHTTESKQCEFCGSSLPSGRIEALLGHFNEADKKLKEKIEMKVTNLQQSIQKVRNTQLPNKAQFYTDLQTQFTSRAITYNQEKENYCSELSSMVEILNTKKQKTTEIVSFSRSLNNNFQTSLNSVNETIGQHNQKSDNFQTEKDKAVELLKNHHLSEIFDEVKNLDKEIEECGKEILKFENGDGTDALLGITKLKKQTTENKGKISSEHKACSTLNEQLQTFLGRAEIMFEVSPEGGYVVKRNKVIAKNLSEGEKTAIAFVYFVVHLKDQNFDIANGIIVVDDPISSLDSNSLFQAFAFLKNAVKDAKQVFILTHNFSFLKLILNWLNRTSGRKYYMIKNQYSAINGRTAFISELDKELREHESEYHYLFKVLYTFETDGSIASVYHIPNVARKVLDTFLMFRVPNGENSYKKMEKLVFDENKKTAIYKFTNDQSHITGDGFDPSLVPEAQKNIQYLLEMMKAVFPEHYQILEEQFSNTATQN